MSNDEKGCPKYMGFYEELADIVGDDKVKEIHERFHGLEVALPSRLYSQEYVIDLAINSEKKNIKELARKFGYNERYLRRLIREREVVG